MIEKKMRDRSKSTDSSADPLSVSSLIGQGMYQKLLIIFLCLFISPFMAFNNIPQYLILLEPEFECEEAPKISRENIHISSIFLTTDSQDNYSDYSKNEAPINPASLFLELKRECYEPNTSSDPCRYGYKYKTDFIYPTIVSENDWICDNANYQFLAHSLYWLGSPFGVLIIGQISDKYGRIPAIVLCHLIAGAAGILTPFSEQRLPLFMTLRFLLGFVIISQGSIAYVLVMELIESNQRSLVSNFYLFMFSISAAALPWFAYFLHDWEMLSVLTSVPFLIVPFFAYFIPESIKWQVSVNRIEEAKLTIKKIAAFNGTPLSEETIAHVCLKKDLIDTNESMIDILKYRRFLRIFSLTTALWLVQNITSTGAMTFVVMATDNPYMMITIHSFCDMLSSIASKYASDLLGRKRATVISFILAGILYPASGLFDQHAQKMAFLSMIMIARFVQRIGFNVQFLYAAEVYPTNIRSRAYALRMSIGSIGNLIAPQVVTLGVIHPAVPLMVFGITSLLASTFMISLPESKGCELPKSLIDGELIGLEGEKRMKVASKYQQKETGGLEFCQKTDKEVKNNLKDFDLKERESFSIFSTSRV